MKCPNLEKWVILNQCNASVSNESGKGAYYIPSIFQLEEYCKTKQFTRCPFFKYKEGKEKLCGSLTLAKI